MPLASEVDAGLVLQISSDMHQAFDRVGRALRHLSLLVVVPWPVSPICPDACPN